MLVAALATAVAMTTSVGIMVGSFRQTVLVWLGRDLPADLYVSPAGYGGAGSACSTRRLAERIERLAGCGRGGPLPRLRDPLRGPAGDAGVLRRAACNARHGGLDFLSGRPARRCCAGSSGRDSVIVSEPFANKHGVRAGDVIALPLGGTSVSFRIVDVYYDYSGERGFVMADRVAAAALPARRGGPGHAGGLPRAGSGRGEGRARRSRTRPASRGGGRLNAEIRRMAVTIFDRTFAITYALEAVSIFVAVMGMAGALLALVIDRRRELGLLRFLGGSTAQVRRLVLFEAGLLGLLANLAGLALGIAISLLLVFVINKQSFGWTIQFHWPVGVLLGASHRSSLPPPSWPASTPPSSPTRLNPIEVVHEE